jgi:hypothetical protein
MSLSRRLRGLALALLIPLAIAVAGAPAEAVDAPPGSKNFTPPRDVPNYFSNESGPFRGGANANSAQSETAPIVAAPGPRGKALASASRNTRHHAARLAKVRGHTRLAHGKAPATRQVAHTGAARSGKASVAKSAHAQARPANGKAVAAKSRAASSKGKRIARAHG